MKLTEDREPGGSKCRRVTLSVRSESCAVLVLVTPSPPFSWFFRVIRDLSTVFVTSLAQAWSGWVLFGGGTGPQGCRRKSLTHRASFNYHTVAISSSQLVLWYLVGCAYKSFTLACI